MREPDMAWPERYARNTKLVRAFANGASCRELSETFNLSHVAVLRILRTAGLDTKMNAGGGRRAWRLRKRDELIVKAHALGKTLAAIGREYDLSRQRIEQILKKAKEEKDEGKAP